MSTSRKAEAERRRALLERRVLDPTRREPAFEALRERGMNLVPGTGNLLCRVAIVGEAPGETEDKEGVPFVGPAGALLDDFIKLAGLVRADCWITNVSKYRPVSPDGSNRQPNFPERLSGAKFLRRELAILRPKLVVLCGRTAYQSVRPGESISRDRGRPFVSERWPARTYYPTLHPSACLQGPEEWMDRTRADWRRIQMDGMA